MYIYIKLYIFIYLLCYDCSVEKFSEEMDTLLILTLSSRVVEKLSVALYDCLFNDELLFMEQEEMDSQLSNTESKVYTCVRI